MAHHPILRTPCLLASNNNTVPCAFNNFSVFPRRYPHSDVLKSSTSVPHGRKGSTEREDACPKVTQQSDGTSGFKFGSWILSSIQPLFSEDLPLFNSGPNSVALSTVWNVRHHRNCVGVGGCLLPFSPSSCLVLLDLAGSCL